MGKIAIIGTGIAAATLTQRLGLSGIHHDIELFDKSRGMGGRMATRYTDTHQFDHGAQFFTARTPPFQAFLSEFVESGDVAEWKPDVTTLSVGETSYKRPWFEPHYVATPRMNGVCKSVLGNVTRHLGTEIGKVERRDDSNWLVSTDEERFGPYDWVVTTAPAPQSAKIFASAADPDFDSVSFDPCIALMVPLIDKPRLQAAVAKNPVIEWIALTDSKPGRDTAPSLVALATPEWSRQHLESDPSELVPDLVSEVALLTGIEHDSMRDATAHRWRFARTRSPLGRPFWIDPPRKLAACGDWCLGRTVEDAFTSANELARTLSTHLIHA